ncbi:MAG: MBL fold metallo-hydrolase [Gemmatimonadetes bacterium]|nr:MBL fold metallo-hydrolase [Gemmatimonadota bacterium]
MRVCVLGSGSEGNATLVEVGTTRVLVDAGFSARDLERRFAKIGIAPGSLTALVVTHDHADHTRGMGVFARRHRIPIYTTPATLRACARLLRGDECVVHYRPGAPFEIGEIRIAPFLTCHDAVDPVAVTVFDRQAGTKLGIATDLGRPTAAVRHALSHCDLLVLEANHDEMLLRDGPYPWSVKQRIASSHGHLSNRAAAELVRELLHPRLVGVILAHLSEACNDPPLARAAIATALADAGYRGYLAVARQDEPLGVIDVEELRRRAGPEQLSLL